MSWLLAVELIILAGSYGYHRWIEDKPPPLRPGAGNVPRIDEGAPIPLIYGRCRVRAPILAFIGNGFATGFGDDGNGGFLGFNYSVDMLYVIGIPFYAGTVTLNFIYAADYTLIVQPAGHLFPTVGTGTVVAGRSSLLSNNLFNIYGSGNVPHLGGNGISGQIDFWDGRQTQTISDGVNGTTALSDTQAVLEAHPIYLDRRPSLIDATQIPGYRNMSIACLYQWNIGFAPTLTSYGFDVTALNNTDIGLPIGEDANPAAVIFDLITSTFGKLGLPTSRVDLPSFQAAAAVLFAEQHGYSRAIEQFEDATAIISDILRQIDGLLYEEPTTGMIVLRLIRNDYDITTLADLNPDNAMPSGSGWYSVQGWSETLNQVRLTFTDRIANYADGLALGQNAANVVSQGNRLRNLDVKFVGCCTRDLAQRLASRELAVVSRPTVKATMTVNRNFYATRPGDVLTFTWPELGIVKMAMRVAEVDRGQLHDGRIVLKMMRDIFDVTTGAFPEPPVLTFS